MTVAGETPDATPEPPCRRIVLAAITIDDEAIEAFAPPAGASAALSDPDGFASMPLRFKTQAPWWTTTTSIGTGTPPTSHGVLTALAFDADGRGAHPRRESDCDRPWLWNRVDRAGGTATMCGWPALLDLGEPGPPAATAAAVLSPRRLLAAARAAGSDEAARDRIAAVVRPSAMAADLPGAIRDAVVGDEDHGPHTSAVRTVAAVCAAAEELERRAVVLRPERRGSRLRCLGLQLLADPREADEGDAEPTEHDADDATLDAVRREHGERLAAVLARLARDLDPEDVLLAAVVGRRRGRLWHRGMATDETFSAAIDLVPTVLEIAGLPVPGDLPGRSLVRGAATTRARSWDLSGWQGGDASNPDGDVAAPTADRVARAREVLKDAASSPERGEEATTRLRALLGRHFETTWALALDAADWSSALQATEGLVELRGDAVDLWRHAFAAERAGEREIVAETIATLRRGHPEHPATAIAALLEPGPPSRELVESIDLADVTIPTQRSVVGRAAAQLGLVEIARRALGPLIASDRCIPADRIAIANVLLSMGEAARAVAALGGLGGGPGSPGRMRILRARCLAAADRRDDALALLDRLLIETPFDTEARTLRERIAAGGS